MKTAGMAEYLKRAFLYRWNLLLFIGAAVAGAISPFPDAIIPLVLAAEAAYLGGLVSRPRFRDAIDAQVHKESRIPQPASESLIDGSLVTAYTVSNLQPSSVAIPGYTPKGTLYQADISARSDGGVVTPMVRDFSARGPNGQTYKLIDKVEVPNGLNPAPITQGSESSGTLYFDVTGAPPNGVVYNDGLQDILIWTSNVPGASAPGAPPNSSPAPGGLPGPAVHS